MRRPKEVNIVIGIGIFAVIAIAAYWAAWYTAPELVQSRTPADADYTIYIAYEQVFPLPDAFVAIAALVGVFGLLKMHAWGLFSMLLASGGALFLGLEDLAYDLEHDMFLPLNGATALELVIVIVLLSLGLLITILLWKHRREFSKQE